MLRESAFLVGHLSLVVCRVDRNGIIVVFDAWVCSLALATGSRTESVQLGGKLGLGLDERSTVIPHRLVPRIGVLCENGKAGRHQNHDEENKCEHCVHDEENYTHDTSDDRLFMLAWSFSSLQTCTYRLIKDLCEEQQEDGAKEVESSNGDIESIRLLVHVRAHDGDTNEERYLDNNESDGLRRTVALCETNKHGFDNGVGQDRNDEVVHVSPKLDIEKAPLVESNGIRVQNVGGVLVHDD